MDILKKYSFMVFIFLNADKKFASGQWCAVVHEQHVIECNIQHSKSYYTH